MKQIIYLYLLLTIFAISCKKSNNNDAFTIPPTIELPTNAKDGVVFINGGTSAIVTLFAPHKTKVSLIGDFNNWHTTANEMQLAKDGKTWFVQIDNLQPDTEYAYQFEIDGQLRVADPYCEKILDPQNDKFIDAITYPNLKAYPNGKTTGIVSVMQANQPAYNWKNTNFKRPEKNDLIIYELLIRDFTTEHSYASTLGKLDYLKTLGINAIELMPINEFEGNLSWGYNPSFYFAPDKYYGTKQALKNFIDECHGKGIAVIVDIVLNHSFSQSPMVQMYFENNAPTAKNPWFNTLAKHPYNVGFDFNHESDETKRFSKNVIRFWMQEYKIDGFRFDLSKGFTQKESSNDGGFAAYDASRVAIWKQYHSFIKSIDDNNFYTILEHFADTREETELTNDGLMVWANINHNMNEATMGWLTNSDFSWGFFKNHGFAKSDGLVSYMESHDEERLNFKNISFGNVTSTYSIKNNLPTSIKRLELAAALFFAIPGPKMLWQFGELGYDVSINENGRTGNKPIRWDYFQESNRKSLYNVFTKMITLKKANPIFNSEVYTTSLNSGIKYIKLSTVNNTVIAIGNFDITPQKASVDFGASGVWMDSFGTPITLASNTYDFVLAPGEYHVFSKNALKY